MQTIARLQQSQHYRWIILLVTTISQTTVSICSQGMQPLGPFFKQSFLLTSFTVGILVSMMELGMVATLIVAGRLVDWYGERRVLFVGGVMTGVFVIAAALASNVWVLAVLLFLGGAFSASAVPAGSKAVMTWFPYNNRGLAMGIRQTGIPLGGVLASLILPPLADNSGWELSLVVGGVISITGALICYAAYREQKSEITVASPLSLVPSQEQSSIASLNSQPLTPKPQSLRQVISNRALLLLSFFSALFIVGQYSLVIFIVFYLSDELHIPLLVASTFLAVAHASGAVGRIVWGLVSDKWLGGSRKQVLYYIGAIGTTASAVTALMWVGAPYWLLYPLVAAFGFSMVGWTGMYVALVSEIAGRNQAGTALGFSMTILQFGKVIGPPLFGLVHDITGSFRPSWWLLAGLILASTFMLRSIHEKPSD